MTDALAADQARTEIEPATEVSRPEASQSICVIAPGGGWKALNVREMWRFRELLYFLTLRDIQIRYKQALLGAAWAILQPLLYMIVFYVVFNRMTHAPTNGLPPLLFIFCGLTLWMFFSTAITQAGNSVIGSEALITKVYFPRLAIPFSAVSAALFDFAVTFVVLVLMILYYALFSTQGTAITATWTLLLIPFLILLTFLAALGVGTLLAALNVSYRDFKHTIPVLVQVWMLATPAIFWGEAYVTPEEVSSQRASQVARHELPPPASVALAASAGVAPHPHVAAHGKPAADQSAIPSWIKQLLKFNPMTGLIHAYRAALLGQPMPWDHLAYSAVTVMLMFLGGCFYYHRVEDSFADII